MATVTENLEKFLIRNGLLGKNKPHQRNFHELFTYLQIFEENNYLKSIKFHKDIKMHPKGFKMLMILDWKDSYIILNLYLHETGEWSFERDFTFGHNQEHVMHHKLKYFNDLETYKFHKTLA